MNFSKPHILGMLATATTPGGVAHLLQLANGFDLTADGTIRVNNGGSGGVHLFRRLKAPLACAVAKVTTDPDVLRYIATKEKRTTVCRALGHNENLPQEIVDVIQNDNDHPANPSIFRDWHRPLWGSGWEGCHVAWTRILAEADDAQLSVWYNETTGLSRRRRPVHAVFQDEDIPWNRKIRLLKHEEDPVTRVAALITACATAEVQDVSWSEEVWDPIFALLPHEQLDPDHVRLRVPINARSPRSDGFAAPLDWVMSMLDVSTETQWRKFAVQWGGPEVLTDSRVAARLTPAEYLELQTYHRHSMAILSSESADRLVRKTVAEGDATTAGDAVRYLRHGNQFISGIAREDLERVLILATRTTVARSLAVGEAIKYATGATGVPSDTFRAELLEALQRDVPADVIQGALSLCVPVARDSIWGHFPEGISTCSDTFRENLLQLVKADQSQQPYPGSGCGVLHIAVLEFERRFPNADQALWDQFVTLWASWEGTVGELLDTIESLL